MRFTKRAGISIVAVMSAAMLTLSACATGVDSGGGDAGGGGSDCVAEGANAPRAGGDKYIVYMNALNIGNAWQEEAANLGSAVAKMAPYSDCVEVRTELTDDATPQGQISQLQSMVAAGADAVVMYALSPTALNSAIREACSQGVTFVSYDATVTEPCAYNVSYITTVPTGAEEPFMGFNSMTLLAELMGGTGDIFFSRGIVGTSTDNVHYLSAMAALQNYPDMNVLTEYEGMWSSPVTQTETAAALGSFPNVDGLWCGYGESGCVKALEAAGLQVPISGETSQYFRERLLDGWPGVSIGSPPAQGGIGMKVALAVLLEGPDGIPFDIEVPYQIVTAENVTVCVDNEYQEGCNVFEPGTVGDESTADIFNEMLPEATLGASQTGEPEAGAEAVPFTASYLQGFEQDESVRFVTREACPEGWTQATLPQNVEGCSQG
ncbi:sugar ABC transporter substrate-binding protein [Microcella alkalica]|uniref:Ribose transport system substrate-binding protein n=1 Tax=Microcella alkalica TaxID=355930 RepID=A0A839E823_9MICO|nr:substrate-binding domain-containing protein [Microcella alkalica]MBA8847333.1 ribose transport system substrate-binding protein [Microcella alkalica]